MPQFRSSTSFRSLRVALLFTSSCALVACSSQTRSPLTVPPDSGRDAARADSGGRTDSGGGTDSGRQDSGSVDARTSPVDSGPPVVDREWFSSPRSSAAIFATGHSLIDRVFGRPLENGGPMAPLAQAAGKTHTSLLQDGAGSSTALRRQDIEDGTYSPTPNWASFDTLIVTERVDIAGTIRFENSIENIGWFVDNVRNAGSSPNEYFFYETWWELNGTARNGPRLTTPQMWMDHVRDELPLYECVAERVATQRGIRMRVVPGALALSELLTMILEGRAAGLTQGDIFEDSIHMTDLGDTFLAMVFLATIYRTPTEGLTVLGIPASTATLFASIADRVVGNYFANFTTPTPTQCRAVLQDFCVRFGDECADTADATFPNSAW